MSEYLNELRESARQVIDGSDTPALEATTWPLMVELGWLLTTVPETLDGLGLGIQEACALHTELGRGLSESPFLPAMLAIEALSHSEFAEKADWIATIAGGQCVTASLVTSTISLESSRLSGLQLAVLSADNASHVLVWTQAADCVALVALDQPGVTVTLREAWDTTRRLFDVRLDVPLEQQLVLAQGNAAARLIARLETVRDFSLAADSLGAGAALLDTTVEHLQTRHQFGRPLALFQSLKHRCADMKCLLAGAEALLADSLIQVGDDLASADARLRAQKAKYLACSAFSDVAEDALQLHGGIGMASEHPCHLYLKRAMLSEHLGDAEDSYLTAIADSLLITSA
mgnify:CR=1 FL=1